ncbi:CMP-N-acetylneuraminate-beta-galactosamide-alpha-2,3-sialyltransferase 2-like isoform X2 [Erythrolamprus reginae]|uniref:CMP-N-acetylneuraminate-beta-galactosamide- alpha-2,3-sialyltransferase 2-like isoform X2 n=1 Tax=Erythrolamprus reginae TaxID=121349 RepID=UPI00396C5EE3
MKCKKKLWIVLALCFALSIWKIYITVSPVSKSPIEWLLQDLLMKEERCYHNKCIGLSSWNWFCDHFDPSVDSLLTLENSDIQPEVLRWWLKLQRSKDDNQIQKMVKYLFDVLQSPPARTQDVVHCGTCAVVGNSGRLRGSNYGKKIDSHNFVMRTYKRVKRFIKADKSKILIIHPGFLKYIQDKWTKHHGKYPSTGLITLFFAIHTCTQVSAFGFGADRNGNWHHYWEHNRFAGAFRKSGVHNGTFELQLMERLTTEGKLAFYK